MNNSNKTVDMSPKVFTYSPDEFFDLFISYVEGVRAEKYHYTFDDSHARSVLIANKEDLIFIVECHLAEVYIYWSCVGLTGTIEHHDVLKEEIYADGFAKFFYTEVQRELKDRLQTYYLTKQEE